MSQHKMGLRSKDRNKQRDAYTSVGYTPSMKLPACNCMDVSEILAAEPMQPVQIVSIKWNEQYSDWEITTLATNWNNLAELPLQLQLQ